jgi:outer membrane protein assembly factor BamA/autotransporter translocation and assembly factor TamB
VNRRRAAVVLVLALVAGLALLGAFPQRPLKRLAEARLSSAAGGRVTIERLHVVPWRLSVAAQGVSLDSPVLGLRIASLRAVALPSQLRGASLALRSLEVEGLDVRVQPGLESAAPAPSPTAPAASAPCVRIESLRLRDGRLRYSDPALGGDVRISGIEAEGSVGPGRLELRAAEILVTREPAPPTLAARARVTTTADLKATLDEASIDGPRSRLRLSGALGPLASPAPELRFEADLDAGELGPLAGLADAAGALRATGRFDAAAGTWRAELQAPRLGASGVSVTGLAGWVSGSASRLDAQLTGGAFGGHVRTEVGIAGDVYDVRVDASGVRAESLATLAGPAPLRGPLSGSLRLRGPSAALQAELAVEAPALALDGVPLSARAEASGRVAPKTRDVRLAWSARVDAQPDRALGAARLVGAHLEASGTAEGRGAPELTGRAQGRLDLSGASAVPFEIRYAGRGAALRSAALRVPEFALSGIVPDGAGSLGLAAELHGSLARPSGHVRIAARDVAWRGVGVGTLQLDAEGRDGQWTLEGEAPSHGVRIEAVSPLPPRGERRIAGTLSLAGSAVAALAPLLPEGVPSDGRVSGRLAFDAPVADPTALVLNGGVDLAGAGYEAHVSGRGGTAARAELDVRVQARAEVAALERVEAAEITGQAAANVRVGGTRADPVASGSVRLDQARISGDGLPPVSLVEAVLAFDGTSVELRPAVVVVAGGQVTASGRASLDGPARLELEWTGLRIEELLETTQAGAAGALRGRLDGRATLNGRGREVAGWTGDATIEAVDLRAADLAVGATPLVLRLERGVVSAAPVTLRAGPGALDLGGRVDVEGRTLALTGKGAFDLRALSPLVGTASLTGQAEVDLAVSGTFDAPAPRGSLVVRDAAMRLRDIPEALTGLQARAVFDADAVRLEEARASLGGGTLTASGGGRLAAGRLSDLRIEVRGRDMALRYPVGLRSRLEADLVLEQRAAGYQLSGDVRALRGLYDLDLAIEQTVRAPVVEAAPSPLLRSIGLDIRVALESPVLIRNKLASVDVEGGLQFRGDLETPAPFGRLEIARGGKIFLSGREFGVETGRLSYAGDWDPEVALKATRRIRDENDLVDHDVELSASGRLATVQPVLRAEGLSDGQTLALVATGRTTGATGKEIGASVAGQQAANLVLGSLSQGLGFDEVWVQPELLARETDPGARFTFGKQLTPILSLIYSLSLKGPEQRFIQVEARLPRGISIKGQRTDDGVLAAAAGQALRFGGAPRRKAADERIRLAGVRVEGDLPPEARKLLELEAGQRVAAWDVQEACDRVRRRLHELGHIEAQVGGRIVDRIAEISVEAGPRFEWKVVGMSQPPSFERELREALYEEDAVERVRARLLETLRERGHLRARVVAERPVAAPGIRTLTLNVEPGPRLQADVEFPGAGRLGRGELLEAAGGPAALLVEPDLAVQRIMAAYARANRFGVRVAAPAVEEAPGRVRIRVAIDEGAAPRVAAVEFEQATLPAEELLGVSGLAVASPFAPAAAAAAAERIRNHYYRLGYPQAGVVAETVLRGPDVAVRFRVREGERLVVGGVEIVGLSRTRESVVRRQIRLKPGDPLDPRELARTERRLLDLGSFAQAHVSAMGSPATVRIELVERERVEAAYDLRWSEESGAAAQVDAELRNLLGLGLNFGGRYRFGADDREARLSLLAPTLRRGKLMVAAFETQEDFEATDIFTGEPLTNTQTERVLELQQALRVKRHTNLLAGYRYKTVFSTAFPEPIHIASLDLSGVRETRDNPLDARRGYLASLSVRLSPRALGSELTFVKTYAQFFLHRPRGAFTWSQGLSLGLAHGFDDQLVIPSERFFAGGANSLRGFARDSVGPVDILGEPKGGDAVLVFTEELRYRHRSGFGLAVFWDAGNVFEKATDLGLDLRHDLGAGLRWASPIGLLRLDVGFPLARREDEDSYQVHFSLGQVF